MIVKSETLYMIYASAVGFRSVAGAALDGWENMPARSKESWAAAYQDADALARQLTCESTPLEPYLTGERLFTTYREQANRIAYGGGPIPAWDALPAPIIGAWNQVAGFFCWAWGRFEFVSDQLFGEKSPNPPRIFLFDLDPRTLVGIAPCDDGEEGWVVMQQPFADDDARPVCDDIGPIVYVDIHDAAEVCKTGHVWKHDMGEEDAQDPDSGPMVLAERVVFTIGPRASSDPACLSTIDEHASSAADSWTDIAARETWIHQDEETGAILATPVSDRPTELLRAPTVNEEGIARWRQEARDREANDHLDALRWGDVEPRPCTVSSVEPSRFSVLVSLRGYSDLEPLAERVRAALESHPTLSLRVDEVTAYTGDLHAQREAWLHASPTALASLQRGMEQASRGELVLAMDPAADPAADPGAFVAAFTNVGPERSTVYMLDSTRLDELALQPGDTLSVEKAATGPAPSMGSIPLVDILKASGLDLSPAGLQRELEEAKARPWIEAPWERSEMEDPADGEEAWHLPEGAEALIQVGAATIGKALSRQTWRLVLLSPLYTDPQHARNAGNRIAPRFLDACLSGGLTEVEPGVYGTVNGRLQVEQ